MDLTTATRMHVAVIGGGIAGLSCARALEASDTDCDITLLEASSRLGGKVASERIDGFVLDAGSDVCIADKLRNTAAFHSLALGTRLVRVNPRELPTFAWRDGGLHAMPVTFTGELVTFPDGMQGVVDALIASLRTTRVERNAEVTSLERADDGWTVVVAGGRIITVDAVVVALPARAAARLLEPFAPSHVEPLTALQYLPTTTVSLAWRRHDVPHHLHGTGYLIAGAGDGDITACTWTSSKIPSHAPDGHVLLRGYIRGRVGDPIAFVRAHLQTTLGITATPLLTRVTEWAEGLPEYPGTHTDSVARLEQELARTPGLTIAGAAFHGVGVPDCILSGESAANSILSRLSAPTS